MFRFKLLDLLWFNLLYHLINLVQCRFFRNSLFSISRRECFVKNFLTLCKNSFPHASRDNLFSLPLEANFCQPIFKDCFLKNRARFSGQVLLYALTYFLSTRILRPFVFSFTPYRRALSSVRSGSTDRNPTRGGRPVQNPSALLKISPPGS